jgi:anti-sigma regulatory factor (Ser/Thr protein kinase)
VQALFTFKPADRHKVVDALQEFARSAQLPASVLQAADLCLEEHITNVIQYGLSGSGLHDIVVHLALDQDCFVIEVKDDGKAFDPLKNPEVNTAVPLEKKPVGGLGIHLMRRFMDQLEYRRESGQNVITMRKHLPGAQA